jgi:hypothetical protein
MYYLSMLFLLLISSSAGAASYDPILENIKPGTITIVGETHRRIESPIFIENLVVEALKQNQCLTLALEIDDDQQAAIDRAMSQAASVADIAIFSTIDHSPMRQMIQHMAALKIKSPCLNVLAIDTGFGNPHDRDEWMAKRLSALPGDIPVLVLLGALHTLKKVDWLVSVGKPSVAERLENTGYRVKSFPQLWLPEECPADRGRMSRFVSAGKPEALPMLNESLMALMNANRHTSAQGVVDGFVIWECSNTPAI